MSEFQQKRPLSGAQFGPAAVPTGDAGLIIHRISSLPENAGGPQIDQITLYVHNSSITDPAEVTVFVQNQAPVVLAVPANSTRAVFAEQPFLYNAQAPQPGVVGVTETTGGEPTGLIVAWGSFTRA